MSEQILWELMEMEAIEKYYLYKEATEHEFGKYADRPAIIISTGPFVSPDARRTEFYTVWFGQGIAHYNFKNLADAENKVKEILATARTEVQAKIEYRNGRIQLIHVKDVKKP